MADPFIISADALIAMDPACPPIMHNAGVVIDGERITAVGELAELRRQFGNLPEERLTGVLLPGLVNAHTHLELSYQVAEALRADHFTQWVNNLIAGYPPADKIETVVRGAVRSGIAESLAAGVTTLGDISRHAENTRDELLTMGRDSVIPRIVSYGEVMGLGKLRDRAPTLLDAATTAPPVTLSPCHLVTGISPHAPYTVEGPTLRACVRQAIVKHAPIAMHLAELADETTFLADLSGPLGASWEVMQKLDILDERVPLMIGGPIRWAQRWGLLLADARDPHPREVPVLLAHVNYCDRGELAQLAVSRAAVAFCPRTHAYFKHPPHRYREMLDAGINVCLGTDSRASNPDLNVLREAQLVWQRDRCDPLTLLKMITVNGAGALGLGGQIGSLAPGKLADVILLPVSGEGLAEQIVSTAPAPATVWIGGKRCA